MPLSPAPAAARGAVRAAYLWTQSDGERQHFDALWTALGEQEAPWSFSVADGALAWVYKAVGVERDERVVWQLWAQWQERDGDEGRSPDG